MPIPGGFYEIALDNTDMIQALKSIYKNAIPISAKMQVVNGIIYNITAKIPLKNNLNLIKTFKILSKDNKYTLI